MRIVLDIVLFAILFNIAAALVGSIGFFPTTLYSDVYDLGDDPESLPTTELLFQVLVTKPTGEIAKLWGQNITISFIMGIAVIGGIGIAILSRQTTIIAMALVGYLFWTMYANSKQSFEMIASNLNVHVNYIALMIGIMIAIMFVIVMMDYASGKRVAAKS